MKSRNALFVALALGLGLTTTAFAQDQSAAPTAQPQTATPTDPAATTAPQTQTQSTDPTAQTTSPTTASPTASPTTPPATSEEAKKVTWSDLDTDKDGKLNKTEVAPVQALTQVFDAKNQADAAAQPQNEG
jgi:hypothetical protein